MGPTGRGLGMYACRTKSFTASGSRAGCTYSSRDRSRPGVLMRAPAARIAPSVQYDAELARAADEARPAAPAPASAGGLGVSTAEAITLPTARDLAAEQSADTLRLLIRTGQMVIQVDSLEPAGAALRPGVRAAWLRRAPPVPAAARLGEHHHRRIARTRHRHRGAARCGRHRRGVPAGVAEVREDERLREKAGGACGTAVIHAGSGVYADHHRSFATQMSLSYCDTVR